MECFCVDPDPSTCALCSAETAYLCVNTWAGRREYPVEIVKETAKRYKIRMRGNEILPGKRIPCKGDEVFVPKYAIRKEA